MDLGVLVATTPKLIDDARHVAHHSTCIYPPTCFPGGHFIESGKANPASLIVQCAEAVLPPTGIPIRSTSVVDLIIWLPLILIWLRLTT